MNYILFLILTAGVSGLSTPSFANEAKAKAEAVKFGCAELEPNSGAIQVSTEAYINANDFLATFSKLGIKHPIFKAGSTYWVKDVKTLALGKGPLKDFCLDTSKLIEYYCKKANWLPQLKESAKKQSLTVDCTQYGATCSNGVCVLPKGTKVPICGDGIVTPPEQCEPSLDPNCSWKCTLAKLQGPVCGNGNLEVGEACDDGNKNEADICLSTCKKASCGDGFLLAGIELCDDGNIIPKDGCSQTCQKEKLICNINPKWEHEIIKSGGFTLSLSSLDISATGQLHIAYDPFLPNKQPELFYNIMTSEGIWKEEVAIENVSYNIPIHDPALVLDPQGISHVAFRTENTDIPITESIRLATRTPNGKWKTEMIASHPYKGGMLHTFTAAPSLTLDTQDQAHVSYHALYDSKNTKDLGIVEIRYATKDPTMGWKTELIEKFNLPQDLVGDSNTFKENSTIGVDSIGQIHAIYRNPLNGHLKYALRSSEGAWQIEEIEAENSIDVLLKIDSQNRIHVVYRDYENIFLKYALKETNKKWEFMTIDSNGYTGYAPSLALDSQNRPHVAYSSDAPDFSLKHAVRESDGDWKIDVVDCFSPVYVGWNNSIGVGPKDNIHIVYDFFPLVPEASQGLRHATLPAP